MYTKTITVDTNWLDEISGKTVQQAIEYLKTLNPSHVLEFDLEGGDTHGVYTSSRLTYEVPMTNAEIFAQLEKHYLKQIADREKGRQYYIDKGKLDMVPVSDKLIAELRAKLEEAKVKYSA